jgi:N6-adenosine-specific RNA methylase IME4
LPDAVLARLDRCKILLHECKTVNEAKQIADIAETARIYARRVHASLGAINKAVGYRILAEKRLGQIHQREAKNKGTRSRGPWRFRKGTAKKDETPTLAEKGLSKRLSARAQKLAKIPDAEIERAERRATQEGRELSTAEVLREQRRGEVNERIQKLIEKEIAPPTGKYDVIVIDPPWPMEKIERDMRPNQVKFDYPTMSEPELETLELPCADDCHVWLWTTHRFLPMAFRLLAKWDVHYVCTFVWHKPGGFQPVGLPQYNCEFAVYGRRGSPIFADTRNYNVCFNASRGKHSEKPEEFYALLRRVTAGRRLDMFNRRGIKGFHGWGKESR